MTKQKQTYLVFTPQVVSAKTHSAEDVVVEPSGALTLYMTGKTAHGGWCAHTLMAPGKRYRFLTTKSGYRSDVAAYKGAGSIPTGADRECLSQTRTKDCVIIAMSVAQNWP